MGGQIIGGDYFLGLLGGEVEQEGWADAVCQGDLIDRGAVVIEMEEGIHVGAGVEGSAQVARIHVSGRAGREFDGDSRAHLDLDW